MMAGERAENRPKTEEEILAEERVWYDRIKAVTRYEGTQAQLQEETGKQYTRLRGQIEGGVSIIRWRQLWREISPDEIIRLNLGPISCEFLRPGVKHLLYEIQEEAARLGADTLVEYRNNGKVWGYTEYGIPVKTVDPTSPK